VNPGREKAVIYFGGNAEAVARNAPVFARVFRDATVYLMNYRGYGGSQGRPSEETLYRDALVLYDHVRGKHDHVSAIGRSIGSGIATYLAAERELARLVLITPFDSLESVASSHYPVYPMSLMLRDKYDSISRVPRIREQTLILIAGNDRIVMPFHAHELAAAFPPGQLTKVVLPGAGHNSVSSSDDYYTLIRDFLQVEQGD
jgi:pimeloyl-ACP methyl ester carboxylesterase